MAHASDNSQRLSTSVTTINSPSALKRLKNKEARVWLFVLPVARTLADSQHFIDLVTALRHFAASANDNSIVAILTSPQDAAEMLPSLTSVLRLQLWVAVKLQTPIEKSPAHLKENHAALLIFSRYEGSLRHTKTRIEYTYCPHCDKTTKDYGGKKHVYHEYGTLMSDVWRDISVDPIALPDLVIDRLADMFGLEEYRQLQIVDLRSKSSTKSRTERSIKARRTDLNPASGPSQLIRGDSLSELQKLPANSADFCFADPPYNLDKRYDIWDDALDVNSYLDWCNDWIHELARVVRPGGTCAILNIPSIAAKHFHQMKTAGLTFQNWIVWEGLSLPVRMIMPAHYSIVCFTKGLPRSLPGFQTENSEVLHTLKESYCVRPSCVQSRKSASHADREYISDIWWDIHRLKHNSRRVDHPCQLPPTLMRRLISLFTFPDEVVLDPFNGAGTTSLCAEMTGRKYIGIELSEEYHLLALSRHQQLSRGMNPFAKGSNIPKAKNSRVKRLGGVKYKVSKKTLQLEVRRIAKELQRMPARNDVEERGAYPVWMYDEYFSSWGEVCAAARTTGMTETRTPEKKHSGQRMLFD